ncbi:MAG: hypothetical protein B6244_14850 [Candidatus Cloacimonetes bacterium 4572_55]|nr:MAG: hypothetical protein B6244_14850 [Candidatus Cloacimonetes bacterium 4572_55]
MVHASSAINYIAHFVRVANVTKVPLLVEHQDVTITADLYVSGDVSALTFTDRTPFYEGDAIAEIKKIKGNGGEIDHESLPGFVKKIIRKKAKVDHASLSGLSGKTAREKAIKESVNKTATEIVVRDIGAMVSMLTVAIQQVSDRLDILERGR